MKELDPVAPSFPLCLSFRNKGPIVAAVCVLKSVLTFSEGSWLMQAAVPSLLSWWCVLCLYTDIPIVQHQRVSKGYFSLPKEQLKPCYYFLTWSVLRVNHLEPAEKVRSSVLHEKPLSSITER